MSVYMEPNYRTYKAEVDLSGKCFHFVKHGTDDNQVDLAGANEQSRGILMNDDAKINCGAEVAMPNGGAKIILAAALSKGAYVKSDANGQAVAVASKAEAQARLEKSGVIGDIVECIVMP